VGLIQKIKDYFANRTARKIEKSAAMVRNAKAIKEDRWAALDYLAKECDDASRVVPALLARFEYSLEHGINDTREKDIAFEGIIRFGDQATPIVVEHLKSTMRIAWPIKILKKLCNEDYTIDCLISALNSDDTSFDQTQTDKNYDILCHLADYKRPGLSKKIEPFITAPDERVRYAAAEVLMEQTPDEVHSHLEQLLADSTPDNSRIRQTVIRKYLENGWTVRNRTLFPNNQVIGPVFIGSSGKLEVAQNRYS
jgi:HEAT repeat protein